jgi:hypothetical protein
MRSVFTSPRLENVEAVAKMLEEAGIEVRITEDRSYKGNRRRQFSYRETNRTEPDPQVWVIRAEDQPKARAMLREAGLIESSKRGFGTADAAPATTFLPSSAIAQQSRKRDVRATVVMRIRLFLLAIIAFLTVLTLSGVFHR